MSGLVIASLASFACPEANRCWSCAPFLLLLHRLYHPDSCPLDTLGFVDASGSFNARTDNMQSHVADDGCLHIVAGGAAAWHLGWGWTGWCIAPACVSTLQVKSSRVKLTRCLIAPPPPADPDTIEEAVDKLDLARARLLARLGLFWIRRSRWAPGKWATQLSELCSARTELCPGCEGAGSECHWLWGLASGPRLQ